MKLRLYILVIMALASWSCSSRLEEFQTGGKGCITLTVYNTSMDTKANGDITQNPGTENERLLTRLDIFLYPEGKTGKGCVFYKHVSGLKNTSGSEVVPVYVSEDVAAQLFPNDAVQCDVYVVANMPDDVSFTGNETVDQIKALTVKTDAFKNVVASNGSFVAPDKFIMTSECKAQKSGETISGVASLTRAACKITMIVLVPEFLKVKATDVSAGVVHDETWRPYF